MSKPEILRAKSPTDNPYWDELKTWPGDEIDLKYGQWTPSGFSGFFSDRETWAKNAAKYDRKLLTGRYAWAVPDPLTLRFLREQITGPVVEMGAGTGYWAWQLSQLGVAVLAYDSRPPQLEPNGYHQLAHCEPEDMQVREVYFDVRHGDASVLREYGDWTLLLVWPPYRDPMARACLESYPGDQLIYVGEEESGCTGDALFHAILEAEWDVVAEHRPVQFYGIHDWVYVYRRAPQKRLLGKLSPIGRCDEPTEVG